MLGEASAHKLARSQVQGVRAFRVPESREHRRLQAVLVLASFGVTAGVSVDWI